MILRNPLSLTLGQRRLAVLATFADPIPPVCATLAELTGKEWSNLLTWLDMSGLALYLLDNLQSHGLAHWLPQDVAVQLERRAADARVRASEMIADFLAVERCFRELGISYALLKGFSLWPVSVPKMESRSQLDLDYLVAEDHAPGARAALEALGYKLRTISGRSWEFKSTQTPCLSLSEMYKPGRQRSIELHLEPAGTAFSLLNGSLERRLLHGVECPVLIPAELFLGQGLHLGRHMVGECWRAAHLLEFYRHIQVRFHDVTFWREVRTLAQRNPRAAPAIGLVLLMLEEVMGECVPEALTDWTVSLVPRGAVAWVKFYGRRAALGSHPGTKLYLLLAREMAGTGPRPRGSHWSALIPHRLPPAVFHPQPNETSSMRLVRTLREMRFRLTRLRFHAIEGARYLWERLLWPRRSRCLLNSPAIPPQAVYPAGSPAPASSQPPAR